MVEVYLHLLPKVQLHVSALDNSHLHVVHESLESSYTRFNMGCVQWGCGRWGGQECRTSIYCTYMFHTHNIQIQSTLISLLNTTGDDENLMIVELRVLWPTSWPTGVEPVLAQSRYTTQRLCQSLRQQNDIFFFVWWVFSDEMGRVWAEATCFWISRCIHAYKSRKLVFSEVL